MSASLRTTMTATMLSMVYGPARVPAPTESKRITGTKVRPAKIHEMTFEAEAATSHRKL